MNGRVKAYLGLLVFIIVGITILEYSAERPIDWRKTYSETDKIPFGTYVYYNQLPQLFPNKSIDLVDNSPYEYFEAAGIPIKTESDQLKTYIHIDEYATIDDVSAKKLLEFTAEGNTTFIASNNLPEKLLDTLQLKTATDYSLKGEAHLRLENPAFKRDTIRFTKNVDNTHFSQFKADNTIILGSQTTTDSVYTNFIKIKHEKGQLFLHLRPIIFTNFSLLKNEKHKAFTEAVMGYLPVENNLIYKLKNTKGANLGSSKLRFILSKPALRYAWYLALISLVLFLIFNAKRKQRIIKTITPLQNSTIAFTKTIGNLYFETKDHTNLIHKKITYFLEYIRRVYYLDTQVLDDTFVKNLASKSNNSVADIKILIDKIAVLRATPQHSEQDLLDLNTLIEDFYNN